MSSSQNPRSLVSALRELTEALTGRVVTTVDADYDALRAVFNGMIDRRPLAIVRVADEHDVALSLAFAQDHGLPIAIRSGGHSSPGHSVVEDGVVIDVRDLVDIEVDPDRRTVRCGAGVDWGQLDAATQEHGLAVTGGRVSTTGVVGLTIGSGSGWLERVMGLTSDHLIGLRLVTAGGDVVVASDEENFDLLWASRGGGGNFGVITELTFALRPLGPIVTGGARFYPYDRAAEVLRAYREIMLTAPAELCSGIALQTAPPAPFLPAAVHGAPVLGMIVLWAGDPDDAEAGLAALDALGEPLADLVGPIPYTAIQRMMDDGNPYGKRDYFKSGFIDELADGAIDAVVRYGADFRAPLTTIILAPLGANTPYAEISVDHSALGHRDTGWSFQILSLWDDPAEDDSQRAWTKEVAERLSTYSTGASLPNFVADDDPRGIEAAFDPGVMARLRLVKSEFDPENVFRLNNNIAPLEPTTAVVSR